MHALRWRQPSPGSGPCRCPARRRAGRSVPRRTAHPDVDVDGIFADLVENCSSPRSLAAGLNIGRVTSITSCRLRPLPEGAVPPRRGWCSCGQALPRSAGPFRGFAPQRWCRSATARVGGAGSTDRTALASLVIVDVPRRQSRQFSATASAASGGSSSTPATARIPRPAGGADGPGSCRASFRRPWRATARDRPTAASLAVLTGTCGRLGGLAFEVGVEFGFTKPRAFRKRRWFNDCSTLPTG